MKAVDAHLDLRAGLDRGDHRLVDGLPATLAHPALFLQNPDHGHATWHNNKTGATIIRSLIAYDH